MLRHYLHPPSLLFCGRAGCNTRPRPFRIGNDKGVRLLGETDMSARSHIGTRTGFILLLGAMALALAACGGEGGPRKRDADGRVLPTPAEMDPTSTLYAQAVQRAAQGDCDEQTFNVLTCFAYRGHGYEGAQTALGQCHLAAGDKVEGATWVGRAANAGWADAQKLLARLYLRGDGLTENPVEGAKWAKLYSRNPSLLSLGVQPDPSLAEDFKGVLTREEEATADARAVRWTPSYWEPDTQLDQDLRRSCVREARRPLQEHKIPSVPNPY